MAKRENGSGSIVRRKLASGVKYVAYSPATYSCAEDGRVTTKRVKLGSFSTRKEARVALDNYIRHPTTKINYTLRDVYNEWSKFAFVDIQKQTVDNYTAAWDKICTCESVQIADKLVREITTGEMRAVLDYWLAPHKVIDKKSGRERETKPLSKSYITKIKALLTQLFSYAQENNIVDRNYASLIRLPKMQDKNKRAFTDIEFAVLEKEWRSTPGGDAVYALCYLGFRVSEFCELTPFSYDPKAHTLTGGLKTDAGRDRIVPVHKNIQPIIDSWYERGCGTLYADENGEPYNKDKFLRRVWRPAIKAMGLPTELTPHSARHTFATRMAAAGANAEDIQKIMGHADFSVTANTYINQDVSTLQNAVNMMG